MMAIANAYHALCGDDVAKIKFAGVDSMRDHLVRYDDNNCRTIHDIVTISPGALRIIVSHMSAGTKDSGKNYQIHQH